ncbi:MAG: LysM domain-containing protein [Gammaproteobacteria bacterium]
MQRIRSVFAGAILGYLCAICHAQSIALNPEHPQRYTVQSGDTLWKIANTFLQKPWQWRQLLAANQHINNPDRIYPGDVLVLSIQDKQPQLTIQPNGTIKLKPQVRVSNIDNAIPTIPLNIIKPFLDNSLIVDKNALDDTPYIVAMNDQHLVGTVGNTIFVRNLPESTPQVFSLFRPGEAYRDPQTNTILGYAAIHVGEAQLQQNGDPATLIITKMTEEIENGDRLLPLIEHYENAYFMPQAPITTVEGQIIKVLDGLTHTGSGNIVVINKGSYDKLRVGDVLLILQKGAKVVDTVQQRAWYQKIFSSRERVQLPSRQVGEIMIFRTFERLSLGLIVNASAPIEINDTVINP